MNILFVIGNSYGQNDANSNLALTIMKNLKERGHHIVVVGKTDNSIISSSEEIDGIHYERFYFKFEREFADLKEKYIDNSKGYKGRIISTLIHPKVIFKFLQRYYDKRCNIVYLYKKKIEQLCEKWGISVVIAVTNPFFTAIALAKARVNCKKVIYQLDPHANVQFQMNKKSTRYHEEKLVYKLCDKIIITDLLYEENQRKGKLEFLHKMEVLNFPNIKQPVNPYKTREIIYDSKYINCAFVGYFYTDIRSPYFLLKMFSEFENKNIRLNIIGGGAEDILNSYKNILGDRLSIHNRVPIETAMNAMNSADILINVGNTIDNQMPSKIFDYISTGKPILNICKIENCPTLKYSNTYPYILNILETDSINPEDILTAEQFCLDYKGKCIEFEHIQNLYEEYTINNVTKNFEDILLNL